MSVIKKCSRINDFPAILKSSEPTLGLIKRTYGEGFLQAYIEGWIINLCEFVNIGKNMNENQIMETSYLICEKYKALNMADINLIFKNAKSGMYGHIYDRLDGTIILTWFEKHFCSRCEAAANMSIREADSFKSESRTSSFEEVTNLNKSKRFDDINTQSKRK